MSFYHLIVVAVVAGGVGGLGSHLLTGKVELSSTQKEEVGQIVSAFMKENSEAPTLVANALQTYSHQQEEEHIKATNMRMNAERERLVDTNTAIVLGNPNASTKLIFFSDNNCPHCRMADMQLRKVLEKNNDLAIIYRQYPILGKKSEDVAAGVIAVADYDKFSQINDSISQSDQAVDLDVLIKLAQAEGITPEQLKETISSDEVQATLKENKDLGEKIGLQSTPVVILVNGQEVKLLKEIDEESVMQQLASPEDSGQTALAADAASDQKVENKG